MIQHGTPQIVRPVSFRTGTGGAHELFVLGLPSSIEPIFPGCFVTTSDFFSGKGVNVRTSSPLLQSKSNPLHPEASFLLLIAVDALYRSQKQAPLTCSRPGPSSRRPRALPPAPSGRGRPLALAVWGRLSPAGCYQGPAVNGYTYINELDTS